VSAADVTIATVPGPTNNTTQDENAPTIRADISTYNVSSKAAWLGLGCRCPCLVLAGSVAEGAKPACASEETPVLPPTSSAHPFQVFLRRTPSGPPSPHPPNHIYRTPRAQGYSSDPTRPQARSRYRTVQYSSRGDPKTPQGKIYPPTGRWHLHSLFLSHINWLYQLALENFYCPLSPRSLT
jgi:hypothetical protein